MSTVGGIAVIVEFVRSTTLGTLGIGCGIDRETGRGEVALRTAEVVGINLSVAIPGRTNDDAGQTEAEHTRLHLGERILIGHTSGGIYRVAVLEGTLAHTKEMTQCMHTIEGRHGDIARKGHGILIAIRGIAVGARLEHYNQ